MDYMSDFGRSFPTSHLGTSTIYIFTEHSALNTSSNYFHMTIEKSAPLARLLQVILQTFMNKCYNLTIVLVVAFL